MYREIKIVFIDVDGTLTDGVYQISGEGKITKSFYTRDWYGMEQLMRNGIQVVIISQSHDKVVHHQVGRICSHSKFWKDRCSKDVFLITTAVDEKKHEVEKFFRSGAYEWDNIAYMGDAENDYDCIELAGFSGCPTDAVPYVRDKAMYPSDYKGGHGAVHDFCMYLLEQRDKEYRETENENS